MIYNCTVIIQQIILLAMAAPLKWTWLWKNQQINFCIPPVQSVIDHSAPSSSSICTCKILRSNFFLSIIFRLGLEPSRQTSSTLLPGQLSRAHTKTKSILLVTARREKKWLFPAAQFCIRITTADLSDSNAKKNIQWGSEPLPATV